MRFFLLSSLVVLGILNICLPVQVEIYASHCEMDRSLLPVQRFQVESSDLPEGEEVDSSLTEEQEDVAWQGLEALVNPWMQKFNLIK